MREIDPNLLLSTHITESIQWFWETWRIPAVFEWKGKKMSGKSNFFFQKSFVWRWATKHLLVTHTHTSMINGKFSFRYSNYIHPNIRYDNHIEKQHDTISFISLFHSFVHCFNLIQENNDNKILPFLFKTRNWIKLKWVFPLNFRGRKSFSFALFFHEIILPFLFSNSFFRRESFSK